MASDGDLILVCELDERLGPGGPIARHPTDSRRGKNTQLPLADLLRQSVYSRMAGDEDVNDAGRLSHDPAFRLIGSDSSAPAPPAPSRSSRKRWKSKDGTSRFWIFRAGRQPRLAEGRRLPE
jgi:hypothetical protein